MSTAFATSTITNPDWKQYSVYPRILIGDNIPWIAKASDGVCPGCRNRKLTPEMYCLVCDRWGRDNQEYISVETKSTVTPVMVTTLRERVRQVRCANLSKSA